MPENIRLGCRLRLLDRWACEFLQVLLSKLWSKASSLKARLKIEAFVAEDSLCIFKAIIFYILKTSEETPINRKIRNETPN